VPNYQTVEEKKLVRLAQQSDVEATAELYHRHAPAIFRYFYFRVSEQATAEDLTGDVFLEMVKALPRYQDQGVPFAAWLFRIAHDQMVDHYRRAANRRTEDLSDGLLDDRPGPEIVAEVRAETGRLHEAIGFLTNEQQLVVQLRFIEGYSLEETARLMEKTTGAIKAMQHRALNRLARRLKW